MEIDTKNDTMTRVLLLPQPGKCCWMWRWTNMTPVTYTLFIKCWTFNPDKQLPSIKKTQRY